MKRIFLLKGLDCPNCSAKIEKEVGELDGVQSSVVNLMKQTLTINVAQTAADTIASQIETIVHSHEPDVEVSEIVQESYIPEKKQEANESYNNEDKKLTVRLATGAAIYAIGMALTVFAKVPLPIELAFLIVSYVILGGDVVWQAVRNISKGRVFDEHFLMSVSTIGAFVIGEYPEAVAVMLFYQVGEFFQSLAVKRSRKSISDLMDIRPDCATVRRNGELITISPESVAIGEIIIVKPGEKIPLDGVVLDGDSMLDTRALTGESVPRSVHKGDEALSGCMNQTGVLTIKTTKAFGESTASKIIDLVENASSRKAPTENFITTFARYYTPVVVILAAFLAILPPIILGGGWTEWIRRGFVFLVVSCPCALVISIPLTFFGGIGAASKRGVLVKGSNYLEALNNVSVIVFDKTGTLTKGVFNVTDILPANGFSKEQVLEYAAEAESFSNHPIAKSILAAYGKEIDQSVISDYKEISGYGISVMAGEKKVFAGNTKLMDTECIEYTTCEKTGTESRHCQNENCTATTEQRSIAALGHNWKDNGDETAICTRNGCKATHTHAWDSGTITTEPTCTAQGERTYHCTYEENGICTATKTEAVKKLGHRYILTKRDKPTCESDGILYGKCSRCSKTITQQDTKNPALGHDWKDNGDGTATCSREGCGKNHTHDLDSGTTTVEPTCTATGEKEYCCTYINCPYKKTETLKATNESLIATFDEVMQIQQEGRQKRQQAEVEMQRIEAELKAKLLQVQG